MEDYRGGDVGFEVKEAGRCELQRPPLYVLNAHRDLCLKLPNGQSSAQ